MYKLMAEEDLDTFDLASIHAWISAADRMPASLIREFKRRGGAGLGRRRRGAFFVDVYGSVEAGGAVMFRVLRPGQSAIADHFVGWPLPGCRARVVDVDGKRVGRGRVGELAIRARSVLTGYLNDGAPRTAGQWLRTGDLAKRDRLGALHVLERNSDLIKTGGYSVFPAEIERVLADHPDVSVAIAFGVHHGIKGDVPWAAVALRPGAGAAVSDLLAWASDRLADYKRPREIFVVNASDIPRTPSHKIRRSELAASLLAGTVSTVENARQPPTARRAMGERQQQQVSAMEMHGDRAAQISNQPLNPDLPLSVVLGAGGVRGLAHVGLLAELEAHGFHITEMVGTSVGALIIAFYAAVGLDVEELRRAGCELRSSHLLWWALLRRTSKPFQLRFSHRAGGIPGYLGRLSRTSFSPLHHGVQRIGLTAYDMIRREQVLVHSDAPLTDLSAAARGAAALPGFFPGMRCQGVDRPLELVDGGIVNRMPLDALLEPPFSPAQILVADISGNARDRSENAAKVEALRPRFGGIPIVMTSPETLGGGTVMYRAGTQAEFYDGGRRAARLALGIGVNQPISVGSGEFAGKPIRDAMAAGVRR
jgi:predicted acylesterase/phospholipase RssA